jgi:phosphatidate cytidylyltransferase
MSMPELPAGPTDNLPRRRRDRAAAAASAEGGSWADPAHREAGLLSGGVDPTAGLTVDFAAFGGRPMPPHEPMTPFAAFTPAGGQPEPNGWAEPTGRVEPNGWGGQVGYQAQEQPSPVSEPSVTSRRAGHRAGASPGGAPGGMPGQPADAAEAQLWWSPTPPPAGPLPARSLPVASAPTAPATVTPDPILSLPGLSTPPQAPIVVPPSAVQLPAGQVVGSSLPASGAQVTAGPATGRIRRRRPDALPEAFDLDVDQITTPLRVRSRPPAVEVAPLGGAPDEAMATQQVRLRHAGPVGQAATPPHPPSPGPLEPIGDGGRADAVRGEAERDGDDSRRDRGRSHSHGHGRHDGEGGAAGAPVGLPAVERTERPAGRRSRRGNRSDPGAPPSVRPELSDRRPAEQRSAEHVPADPEERRSRAGRNLPQAIGIGVLLAALVVASLVIRKEAFVGVVSATAVIALWELSGAFTVKQINVPVVPLAVGSLGMLVSAFVAGEDGLLVSFALTAFGVLLWRVIDGAEGAARDVAASVFAAAYIPFLAGFTILMLAAPDGAERVIVFFLVTVASDIGGYTAGVLFGKHPMAPTVSPKKSWEGFGGSALACVVVGVVGVLFLLHGPWWAGVAIGAAAVVTATLGDLSESLIKRDLGVKDMGNLLPGHGGMMDRIDSLLVTAPVVYVLLSLLVPMP